MSIYFPNDALSFGVIVKGLVVLRGTRRGAGPTSSSSSSSSMGSRQGGVAHVVKVEGADAAVEVVILRAAVKALRTHSSHLLQACCAQLVAQSQERVLT